MRGGKKPFCGPTAFMVQGRRGRRKGEIKVEYLATMDRELRNRV